MPETTMTPLQMIGAARRVRVMSELAAGGCVKVYVTKTEARRLVRDHDLPQEEVGTVHINDSKVCSIILAT